MALLVLVVPPSSTISLRCILQRIGTFAAEDLAPMGVVARCILKVYSNLFPRQVAEQGNRGWSPDTGKTFYKGLCPLVEFFRCPTSCSLTLQIYRDAVLP